MEHIFTIPGRLPGTNDLIAAINRHRMVGAILKKETTALCAQYALQIKPLSNPAKILIFWVEKDLRRDLDNVSGGIKYILDGLVIANKLKNDTRQWITAIEHRFPEPDKMNPRVEVHLIEE